MSSTPWRAARSTCGVLPIENSIGGSIHRNFDLLLEHKVPIVGEVELPVVHHLLALPGTTLERVRRVYSHPQGLAQCDRFLRTLDGRRDHRHLRYGGKREDDRRPADGRCRSDRLGAGGRGVRADAGSLGHPGLRAQHHAVSGDQPEAACRRRASDKTTIVFTLPNEPGALFKALSVFALRGIDLTKLESRPIPDRKWEYLFYVDLAGDDVPCSRALAHLAEFAPTLRILGSYPSYKSHAPGTPDVPTTSAPGALA